jgi:hypothetical protein
MLIVSIEIISGRNLPVLEIRNALVRIDIGEFGKRVLALAARGLFRRCLEGIRHFAARDYTP